MLVAALSALILLSVAVVDEGDGATPTKSARTSFTPPLQRPLSTRVIHTRISTVRNANAREIGRSLASLHPTWVSGLIRYAKGQHPQRDEIHAWREITRIVRQASPGVRFDVTLNADQYRNGTALKRMMKSVRRKLDNDGWFFDFYSTAFLERPRMIRGAIASAHRHGEFIGGNVFGLSKKRPVPLRSDFLAVQDFRLGLNLPAVRRLAKKIPVVYHLHNHPDHQGIGGCRFIRQYSTAERRAHITKRAEQQFPFRFRVQYPALFPECKRFRQGREILYSYNAFRDPPMAQTIAKLLDRYD